MTAELESDAQLEIGHVLFVDIVGFSKLLVDEQSEFSHRLNQIVRDTERFRTADSNGKLIRLPTGDGMALVFFTNPEAPVQCAVEITNALKGDIPLRMGVHSGPVNKVTDVDGRTNVAGGGINMAQRVMDCGDGGHILLSRRVAEDLAQYGRWRGHLHDLGEVEVKHGVRVGIVNLYTDEVGNSRMPAKVKVARDQERTVQKRAARKRTRFISAGVLAVAVIASIAGYFLFPRVLRNKLDHSIAVLPFANLSPEKENAYFAGGIQDEILTNLARIGDLKVISRTSVMRYAGSQQSVREIAKALGVTSLLEGSVRRAGNRMLITAQLINAITDDHIWAANYERDVTDVFGIQRDVALDIAAALHAKLSSKEEERVQQRPTKNAEAYLVYLQALDSWARTQSLEGIENVVRLYERAAQLDPSFALAFARLSYANSTIYHETRSPPVLEKARFAAKKAIQLQPELSEAHSALGYIYYWGEGDYEHALAEFATAKAGLPNDPDILNALAAIERRQGKWNESAANLEKSASLTPTDPFAQGNIAGTYYAVRNFPAAAKASEHGIDLDPNFWNNREIRALVEIDWKGDLSLLEKFVTATPENFDPDGQVTFCRLKLKLFQRRYDEALQVLNKSSSEVFAPSWVLPTQFPKPFLVAEIYRLMDDTPKAHASFADAQQIVERSIAENPLDPSGHALLGEIFAGLGRKDDAIREGKRAVELLPESKDAFDGPLMTLSLAQIYAMLGDADSALPLLERSLKTPRGVSVNMLKLDPVWDPLRNNPRFQKLLSENKGS